MSSMSTVQTPDLKELQSENLLLKNEIVTLKEQLAWLTKQVFGQKSEKIISNVDCNQLTFEGFENLIPENE